MYNTNRAVDNCFICSDMLAERPVNIALKKAICPNLPQGGSLKRKYLEDIGCKEYPENVYGNLNDSRIPKYKEFQEKTGVWKVDTWNLHSTAMMWIYERLIQYKEDCGINLNYHKFDYENKEWTQGELIDEMIDIAEYCLWEPNNLSKRSKAYKRLSNNKYYKELGKFDAWSPPEIYEKQFNVEQRFWKIWAELYPAMWW